MGVRFPLRVHEVLGREAAPTSGSLSPEPASAMQGSKTAGKASDSLEVGPQTAYALCHVFTLCKVSQL